MWLLLGGSCVVVGGGSCVVAGGHAWLRGGASLQGGVLGCRGACMVVGGMCGCRGHAWLWGACMVAGGVGPCVVVGGVHGGRGDVRGIRRDTVNERAVRILLECILVSTSIHVADNRFYATLLKFTHRAKITKKLLDLIKSSLI